MVEAAQASEPPQATRMFTPEERARGVEASREAARQRRENSQKAIALEMQAIARDIARTDPDNTLRIQAVRAVDVCAERIRVLDNKPLPGSYKPETAKPSRATDRRPRHLSLSARIYAEQQAQRAVQEATQGQPAT